jgi:hypothetical protein
LASSKENCWLVVVVARLSIGSRRKGNDTRLAQCKPLGCSTRTFGGPARNWSVSLQVIALHIESLHKEVCLARHEDSLSKSVRPL